MTQIANTASGKTVHKSTAFSPIPFQVTGVARELRAQPSVGRRRHSQPRLPEGARRATAERRGAQDAQRIARGPRLRHAQRRGEHEEQRREAGHPDIDVAPGRRYVEHGGEKEADLLIFFVPFLLEVH